MKKGVITVFLVSLPLALSACSPSDTEIRETKANVAESFRHYDSLCVGLSTEREPNSRMPDKKSLSMPSEYDRCRGLADYDYQNADSAPYKAWKEAQRYCSGLNDNLSEMCFREVEGQWRDRLPSAEYPSRY